MNHKDDFNVCMSREALSAVFQGLDCEVLRPNSTTDLLDKLLLPRLFSISKSGVVTVAQLSGLTEKLANIGMMAGT